ncbi:polysaccharide lyase family 7 protein [Fulvivirga sp. M361]|uniref:polysaccharide lyase family 7 protein n=1 Tax=Fulvivirga sp. M361 TaxID=2594266 RepID=UPI001C87FFD0|nr:polysaccharide lyase family 7 protein [Fulvivirga sp. M361]
MKNNSWMLKIRSKAPGLFSVFTFCLMISLLCFSCDSDSSDTPLERIDSPKPDDEVEKPNTDRSFTNIDLNNWKVTLPIPRSDGKPLEVEPPEILDYATNETLIPFMYNDSSDTSIVFYTYPGASTANSSFSRTELREQMVPGSNSTNWTFAQGGSMRGTLAVPEISTDEDGKPHRVIIMQIHGRLTNAQRDLIGEDDNNAPPVLKIYWVNGFVRVKTKVLKDLNASNTEILFTNAWGDDKGKSFSEEVGTGKFTLEVVVSEGKMEVTLNDAETFVYDDIHMQKWGVFENYFKAGNYLVTKDEGASAKVKYYELEVSHD